MALTKRQKQVLDFIAGFVDENGYCPSYEEIAKGLDLASLATVHKHISVLESKSYLKRGFNQSRSLELAPKYLQEQRRPKPALLEIPLLGRKALLGALVDRGSNLGHAGLRLVGRRRRIELIAICVPAGLRPRCKRCSGIIGRTRQGGARPRQ